MNLLGSSIDRALRDEKAATLDGLGDRVVEIGPGVGANLRYYTPGTELVAVEPNRRMHPLLRRNANRPGIDLTLLESGAEAIELPDDSVDDVVSTFVLCTVNDPQRAIDEVSRVLRPGGRFRFIEHVAARPGTLTQQIQRAVKRPWRWAFEGCRLDRDTDRIIEDGPFPHVDYEWIQLSPSLVPVSLLIAGTATC